MFCLRQNSWKKPTKKVEEGVHTAYQIKPQKSTRHLRNKKKRIAHKRHRRLMTGVMCTLAGCCWFAVQALLFFFLFHFGVWVNKHHKNAPAIACVWTKRERKNTRWAVAATTIWKNSSTTNGKKNKKIKFVCCLKHTIIIFSKSCSLYEQFWLNRTFPKPSWKIKNFCLGILVLFIFICIEWNVTAHKCDVNVEHI